MRFNETKKGSDKTTNYEGAPAYNLTPELELYSLICTASLQPKFYDDRGLIGDVSKIKVLLPKVKPEFAAKLSVYTREKMYLRSIPIVTAVELAKNNNTNLITKTTERIIQRADEIPELLSYYQKANDRKGTKKLNKLSNQIKKGIAKAFNKFDEYQFAKYNRATEVKLKDALFLSHPKPKNKIQAELFKKIIDDKLEVPYTWEVELTKAGQEGKEKKVAWEELIDSNKLGYMALLRNLRNILNENVSLKHIQKIGLTLSDKELVKKSKQLPFRFLSAFRELQENDNPHTNTILNALEDAIKHSTNNIKGYDYDTSILIASDVSGSMNTNLSPRSKIEYYDIGIVLSMLLQSKCKSVITGIFGTDWKVKQMPTQSILQNTMETRKYSDEVGWSTNGYKVLRYAIDNNIKVDKIMMFTDCQFWDSNHMYGYSDEDEHTMKELWTEYKKINPECKMYFFDLTGYGNTPLKINENDVFLISGWSDKIFDVLNALENGNSVLDEINKIKL